MAEESFHSTMSPKLVRAIGGCSRKRYGGIVVSPRYLRASTGSCHDFCKYGKKHEVKEAEVLSEKKKIDNQKSIGISRTSLSGVHELHRPKSRVSDVHEVGKSRAPRLSDGHETTKSRTCLSDGREIQKSGSPLSNTSRLPKFKEGGSDTSKAAKQEVSSSEEVKPSSGTASSKAKSSHLAAKRATLNPKSPAVKVLNPTPLVKRAVSKARGSNMATERYTEKTKSPGVKLLHQGPSVGTASAKAKSSNMATKCATPKPKSLTAKLLHRRESAVGGLSSRKSDVNLGKATGDNKAGAKKVPTPYVATPRNFLSRAANSKLSQRRSLKIAPPCKNQNKIGTSEVQQPDQDEIQEKIVCVVTSEPENKPSESFGFDQNGSSVVGLSAPPSPSPPPSLTSPKSSSQEECTVKEFDQSERSVELSQPPPGEFDQSETFAAGLSASPSVKSSTEQDFLSLASPAKEEEKEEEEEEEEEEDYYDDDDDDEEEEEEDYLEKSMDIETGMTPECKNMVIKAAKVHAEDFMEPEKLSFRRGKVVEIQSEDGSGPRRLKFKRGRVLDGNQVVKVIARRRSFKPREIVDETKSSESVPEQVVLRHQEMQEKKDDKGLFNNVIEETASKLVTTKKSKVKALVGAFETVISLQDHSPSATTVN